MAVSKLFNALFNALREFSAADGTDVAELLRFLRREGHFAVAMASPMVFSISRVSLDSELETCSVFTTDGIYNFTVANARKFEDVGFSAVAPRPKAVAITVRNQREPVELAQTP